MTAGQFRGDNFAATKGTPRFSFAEFVSSVAKSQDLSRHAARHLANFRAGKAKLTLTLANSQHTPALSVCLGFSYPPPIGTTTSLTLIQLLPAPCTAGLQRSQHSVCATVHRACIMARTAAVVTLLAVLAVAHGTSAFVLTPAGSKHASVSSGFCNSGNRTDCGYMGINQVGGCVVCILTVGISSVTKCHVVTVHLPIPWLLLVPRQQRRQHTLVLLQVAAVAVMLHDAGVLRPWLVQCHRPMPVHSGIRHMRPCWEPRLRSGPRE